MELRLGFGGRFVFGLFVVSISGLFVWCLPLASSSAQEPAFPEDVPPLEAEVPGDQCLVYEGRLNWEKDFINPIHPNPIEVNVGEREFPCIQDLIAELEEECRHYGGMSWLRYHEWEWSPYHDDCYAWALADRVFPDWERYGRDWENKYRQKLGQHSNGAVCESRLTIHGEHWLCPEDIPVQTGCYHCASGYFYLNDQCEVTDQVGELCGNFAVNFSESTPISLLWNTEADIDSEITFVHFALNPGQSEQWSVWKASADTPLLVYDPDHYGRVESATQLFGNWTFGGQRTALSSTRETINDGQGEVISQPWENGYAALATLDADQNGKVDGAELKPLALWFDQNRDAVSQAGEVRPLEQMDIVALYYQADSKDSTTGSIYVEHGFERMVDGERIVGRSVDWYAESASSQFELAAKYTMPQLHPENQGVSDYASGGNANSEVKGDTPAAAETTSTPVISGMWAWWFAVDGAGQVGAKPDGYLIFSGLPKKGKLGGFSLAESPFARAPGGDVKSIIGVYALNGSSTLNESGRMQIQFSSQRGGSQINSEATLSEDGGALTGKTTLKTNRKGQPLTVTYRWKARKVGR